MQPAVAPVFTDRFFVSTYEPDASITVPHLLIGVAARACVAAISRNSAQIIETAWRISWLPRASLHEVVERVADSAGLVEFKVRKVSHCRIINDVARTNRE